MKILIVDQDEAVREMLASFIASSLGCRPVTAGAAPEAIALIRINPDLECIISDYNLGESNGGMIFQYTLSHEKRIPFILCSSDHPHRFLDFENTPPFGFVEKPFIIEPLIALLSSLSAQKHSPATPVIPHEYCSIKTDLLYKFKNLETDVYIQLSEHKYVKIFKKGDVFDIETLKKYSQKKISHLYITRKELILFLEHLLQNENPPQGQHNMDINSVILLSKASYTAIRSLISTFKINKEVLNHTRASIHRAVDTIEQNPILEPYIHDLKKPEHYIGHHSMILIYIANGIAQHMGWASELTSDKIALASLIHDITCTQPILAHMRTLRQVHANKHIFSAKDIDHYLNHPLEAASLVRKASSMPPDVDYMILHHHEIPDGTGFPLGIGYSEMSHLSSFFLLANECFDYFENNNYVLDLKKWIESLPRSFHSGYFKKMLDKLAMV